MELHFRIEDLQQNLVRDLGVMSDKHLLLLIEIIKELEEKVRYLEREQSLRDGTHEGMR